MSTTTTLTTMGTPCARTWSPDWIAAINATETQLNHRICGARLPDATPCNNESDHSSGRCKFHGGFDLTGAPKGNRNHIIHGLYTRRLRTCSQTCPFWNTCPLGKASHDSSTVSTQSTTSISSIQSISAIGSIPSSSESPQSAPLCPFQLTEYNTVLTDALAVVESQPHPNPMGLHAAHNVAMLQVLVSNAMTHMSNGARASSPWTSDSDAPNPSATNAFFRLMREFRASLKLLYIQPQTPLNRQNRNITPPTPEGITRHIQRMQLDTQIDPDSLIDVQLEPRHEELHAKAYLRQSIEAASQGNDVEMAEAFDNVILLDEELADTERDHVLASYRPKKQGVSEEMAERILGNLHLPPLPEPEEPEIPENDRPPMPGGYGSIPEFVDSLIDGKIPPEAFPLYSKVRAFAEKTYTGPPINGTQSTTTKPDTAP